MRDEYSVLESERRFHDQWASSIDVGGIDVDRVFLGSTAPENRFILSHLGDVSGKNLLDLGCGAGESSVFFARRGARVVAGDLSEGMVETARRISGRYGLTIEGKVLNAMELDFPDNTFDVVYASNILHHVQEDRVLSEIHRVLKPGGLACMWEPLRHNPVINIYRMIARRVRTPDEHPLDIRFVHRVEGLFSEVKWDAFWIATLWILVRFFLVERVNPNKERYWRKIFTDEPRLRGTYYRLERIDNALKRMFPRVRRYAWTLAIVAKK